MLQHFKIHTFKPSNGFRIFIQKLAHYTTKKLTTVANRNLVEELTNVVQFVYLPFHLGLESFNSVTAQGSGSSWASFAGDAPSDTDSSIGLMRSRETAAQESPAVRRLSLGSSERLGST